MKVISHKVYPERGVEEMVVEDCHGRRKHLQASIFFGPHPDEFFQAELAEFEAQEIAIEQHMAGRFDPETRNRIK